MGSVPMLPNIKKLKAKFNGCLHTQGYCQRLSGWDSNPWPPAYQASVILTRPSNRCYQRPSQVSCLLRKLAVFGLSEFLSFQDPTRDNLPDPTRNSFQDPTRV